MYSTWVFSRTCARDLAYAGCWRRHPSNRCCRSPQQTWFRGFTSTRYDGNLGGPIGANATCSAELPGTHLCTSREYQWAGSGFSPGPDGFWLDGAATTTSPSAPFSYPRDRDGTYTCSNWRSNSGPNDYTRYFDSPEELDEEIAVLLEIEPGSTAAFEEGEGST